MKSSNKYINTINKIENARKKNNKNWMNILKVTFKYATKETAKIMKSIYSDDNKISKLAKKLTK